LILSLLPTPSRRGFIPNIVALPDVKALQAVIPRFSRHNPSIFRLFPWLNWRISDTYTFSGKSRAFGVRIPDTHEEKRHFSSPIDTLPMAIWFLNRPKDSR